MTIKNLRKNIDLLTKINPNLVKNTRKHSYLLRPNRNNPKINSEEFMEVDQSFRNDTNNKISDIETIIKKLFKDEMVNLNNFLRNLLKNEYVAFKDELVHILQTFLNHLKSELKETDNLFVKLDQTRIYPKRKVNLDKFQTPIVIKKSKFNSRFKN